MIESDRGTCDMAGDENADGQDDRRGHMRNIAVGFLSAVFLLSGGGGAPCSGQVRDAESAERTTIALDLMDLDIPGESRGDLMELPPMQERESPAAEEHPRVPQRGFAEVESSETEMPKAGRAASSPVPGMVPFLLDGLDGTGMGGVRSRSMTQPAGERDPDALIQELPGDLKAVPPPPSRAESLKLPSGMDMSEARDSDVPEIPLLKDEDRGQQAPSSGGWGPSLTMKPLPDLAGTPEAGSDSKPFPATRRPEDYLQIREDLDSRLMEVFERFYKDR